MVVNQKKIAVICNYQLLPERVGGMDYFFWSFDKKCKENGYEIDWFFPNISDHGDYSKLTVFGSNYENVESYFFESSIQKEYSHIFTHFVELCTPIFKKIKSQSQAKIIAVDHNPRPLKGYSLKKKAAKKLKGILYSGYIDLFVGVSNYTVNEILNDFGNHLKKKTITVYNGVIIDDILVRENRASVRPKFMVASHLRKSKGIQDLIDAVKILPNEILNDIQIDIYGDGLFRENLIQKVQKHQLENNLHFKGSVSNLNEIYCQYDYMLQPTHMECFSLSILESLAANVPVITTNVGGNEEVVKHGKNGFIFPAKNSQQLSEILTDVVTGKTGITENTRTKIETNFSLQKMVNAYFDLLH